MVIDFMRMNDKVTEAYYLGFSIAIVITANKNKVPVSGVSNDKLLTSKIYREVPDNILDAVKKVEPEYARSDFLVKI